MRLTLLKCSADKLSVTDRHRGLRLRTFSFNAVDGNRDHDQNKHKYLIFENSKYRIHILVVKRPPTHGLRSDSERIG